MHEQIARVLYYAGVHLLYASLVWIAAWVLTSIPRASAAAKHWIWFATSLNFIVPLAAIFDRLFAPRLSWARPLGFIGGVGLQIAENTVLGSVLAAIWLVGASLMVLRLYARLRTEQRDFRSARTTGRQQTFVAQGVRVIYDQSCQAPAVGGILCPRISLPNGIERVLSAPELNAVLIHEAMHAKRRDNLIRLIHEAGLCFLWFHPLLWIVGHRLALYSELSCDESVILRSRGRELLSALAKLANPESAFLLRSGASSLLSRRLAQLAAPHSRRSSRGAGVLVASVFGAALAGGVWQTVSHTACCFLLRK
jgi:beta-lactamase regulating signal transducer with metallopeptidase domain